MRKKEEEKQEEQEWVHSVYFETGFSCVMRRTKGPLCIESEGLGGEKKMRRVYRREVICYLPNFKQTI